MVEHKHIIRHEYPKRRWPTWGRYFFREEWIEDKEFKREYVKAKPHRPREAERIWGKRVRVYVKVVLYRISVAINAPVSFKYNPKEIPEHTVPVKRKYYGFLFQAWSLKKGELDVEWAKRECVSWSGKALKKLSLDLRGWPRTGYHPEEWWFSFTVGREFPVKVPFKRGLSGRWVFQIEDEAGNIPGSRGGKL